jgi:hypothetical protein
VNARDLFTHVDTHKFGPFVVYSRRKAHKNIITASAGDARSLPNERLVPAAAAGYFNINAAAGAFSLVLSLTRLRMNDGHFNVL